MLNGARFIQLMGLISSVVILNVLVLSPGLLGVEIGGISPVETAIGVTLLIVSLLVVLYGSYILILKPPVTTSLQELKTNEDYITALSQYKKAKVLKKDITLAIDQITRMEKKNSALLNVLSQRFDPEELSYKRFNTVSYEVKKLFYLNIRGILNKLNVFDASEFALFVSPHKPSPFSDQLVQKKTALFNEYLTHITGYLQANEEILLKLDKLLLEISLLDSTVHTDIEEMPCMQEIDELIRQTKFYK